MTQAKKRRILVVEDNNVMAGVVRFSLNRAGFDVELAENGRDACALVEREEFDLVITDHQMPEMSGADFCRFLRTDADRRDVPILMCSGKGFELDTEELVRELGITEFIFKPFSPRQVVESVRAALDGQPTAP